MKLVTWKAYDDTVKDATGKCHKQWEEYNHNLRHDKMWGLALHLELCPCQAVKQKAGSEEVGNSPSEVSMDLPWFLFVMW